MGGGGSAASLSPGTGGNWRQSYTLLYGIFQLVPTPHIHILCISEFLNYCVFMHFWYFPNFHAFSHHSTIYESFASFFSIIVCMKKGKNKYFKLCKSCALRQTNSVAGIVRSRRIIGNVYCIFLYIC